MGGTDAGDACGSESDDADDESGAWAEEGLDSGEGCEQDAGAHARVSEAGTSEQGMVDGTPLCLCAAELEFVHPATGARVHVVMPEPAYFKEARERG